MNMSIIFKLHLMSRVSLVHQKLYVDDWRFLIPSGYSYHYGIKSSTKSRWVTLFCLPRWRLLNPYSNPYTVWNVNQSSSRSWLLPYNVRNDGLFFKTVNVNDTYPKRVVFLQKPRGNSEGPLNLPLQNISLFIILFHFVLYSCKLSWVIHPIHLFAYNLLPGMHPLVFLYFM